MALKTIYEVEIKGIPVGIKQTGDLKRAIKLVEQEFRQSEFGSEKFRKLQKTMGTLKGVQAELRKSTRETKKDLELRDLKPTSLRALQIQYGKLRGEILLLSEAERNSRFGKKLIRDAARTRAEIRRLDQQMNDFRSNVGNYASGVDNIYGKFRNLALTFGVGFGLQELASGLTVSVNLFREQERAINKVEQALVSTGGTSGKTLEELRRQATDLQNNTIFGDEQILNEATAQLLTFTNIAGKNFDRTQVSALNLATLLDGDLKSASIQLGKALNDPVANLSALSRSGIQFSKEQKEVIKQLANTNRLAEAQTIILDELEKQYGGQAEAAAKGAGATQQIGNRIGDLREELGGAISNLITARKEGINKFIDALGKLLRILITNADLIPKIAAGIAIIAFRTKIAATGQLIWNTATSAGSTIMAIYNGKLKIATVTQNLFNKAVRANPLGAAIAIITTAYLAYEIYSRNVNGSTEAQRKLVSTVREANAEFAKEKKTIESLFEPLKSDTATREEKAEAIKELQRLYPSYLQGLDLETASVKQLDMVQNKLLDSLKKTIIERKKQATIAPLIEKQIDAELRLQEIQEKGFDALTKNQKRRTDLAGLSRRKGESGRDFAVRAESEDLQAQIDNLEKQRQQIEKGFEDTFGGNRNQEIINTIKSLSKLTEGTRSYATGIARVQRLQKDLGKEEQTAEQITSRARALAELNKKTEDSVTTKSKLAGANKKLTESLIEQAETGLAFYEAEIQRLNKELRSADVSQYEDLTKLLVENEENAENLRKRLERVREQLTETPAELQPIQRITDITTQSGAADIEKDIAERTEKARLEALENEKRQRREFLESSKLEQLETERGILQTKFDNSKLEFEERVSTANALADKEIEIERFKEQEKAAIRRQGLEELQGVLEGVQSGISSLAEIGDSVTTVRINRIEDQYAREIELAEGNTDKITELENKRDEEKRKVELAAFRRNKAFAITQALIQGALAIQNVAATVPKFDFGVASAIQTAFVVATTVAQVAAIASQKFKGERGLSFTSRDIEAFAVSDYTDIPKAAKGGTVTLGGFAKGKRHSQGGILTSFYGVPVEIEDGEFVDVLEDGGIAVINRRSSAAYSSEFKSMAGKVFPGKRQLYSTLNERFGGIKFAQDGIALGGFRNFEALGRDSLRRQGIDLKVSVDSEKLEGRIVKSIEKGLQGLNELPQGLGEVIDEKLDDTILTINNRISQTENEF